jgi:hypothetical protein
MPVAEFDANWAYLVIASLAWNLNGVALRASLHRTTLWRYLKQPPFNAEYLELIRKDAMADTSRLMRVLRKTAGEPGPSQVPALKTYFQMMGLHEDHLTVKGSLSIDANSQPVPLDRLSLPVKQLLVFEIGGGVLPESLRMVLSDFFSTALENGREIKPEYRQLSAGEDEDEADEGLEDEL